MFDFRLQVFQAVAKRLNFTKAAAELYITQPAVTNHTHELERQFKVKLFDRNGSRIKLTSAGEILLQYTEQLFSVYRNLEFDMNHLSEKHKGKLRLGASTTIAQYLLPPVLAAFHNKFSEIQITLITGHQLHLSQMQFGLWSAIAIHGTSSVVGAANKYGVEALQVATTVKLARALWIIPVALLTTLFFKTGKQKIKIPYFIGLFILGMILNTYFPIIHMVSARIVDLAKIGLTLTLFFIGAGLSRAVLKSVGIKPLLQGIILWMVISVVALVAVMHFSV